MKILGIGNAIVDVICKVDDSFIKQNNLTKSTMKLVDEIEFKNLLSTLKIEETVSGGSVANSIVGLSQLGNKVGFIGKVSDDDLGNKYEEGLKKENVEYFYIKKKEIIPTGTCLILITPDSERTMCTFLGTAGKINDQDININDVKNSEIIFLEGYLWDEGDPKKAFDKAITHSKKVVMSLSDLFCVERHKPHFMELVKNKLDIVFANEQEMLSLIDSKTFEEAISFSKEIKKEVVITRGEKGAVSINKEQVVEVNAKSNLKIISHFLTVFSRWAIRIIVISLLRLFTASITACSVWLSKALVASSKIRTWGLWYKALAIPIRWRWPPESWTPLSPTFVLIPFSRLPTNSSRWASFSACVTCSILISPSGIPKATFSATLKSDKNICCGT